MVKKRQNADIRKPDIIRNYHEVIIEDGLEGASIGKLAKKMNIHPSLIIHYFQNKDNLTLALVDYIIYESGKMYQKLSVQTDKPEQRLQNMVEIFFSDEWCAITDIGVDFAMLSLSCRNERVQTKIRDMYLVLKGLIIGELEKVSAAGRISFRDPGRTAKIIITIYDGYRHFRHYLINEDEAGSFREDMVKSVMEALRKQ